MFLISDFSNFGALCAVGKELCSIVDVTRSAVDIPAWICFRCLRLSIFTGFFLRLVFSVGLIVKVLLRGVLINCLPALDAVELGGCSLQVLGVIFASCHFHSNRIAAAVI